MFRRKTAARILAGILAGVVISGTTAAADNVPEITNGKPVTEENVLEMLREIEQDWPQDTVWGTSSVPGTHKNEFPSTEARRIMDSYPVDST